MEKSRLISILNTLSKTEMKELGHFLLGVPYQKIGSVFKLYNYLKKLHAKSKLLGIDKELVQKKLFKEASNSEKRLYDTISQLYLALEDFIIKKRLDNNPNAKQILLLEALKERKVDDIFFKKIKSIERKWDSQNKSGIEYLHHKYQVKKMHFLHPNYATYNTSPFKQAQLVELIDQYYFGVKLYWELCQYTNKTLGNDTSVENSLLTKEILQHATLAEFKEIPQIRMLEKSISIVNGDDFEAYNELRDDFFANYNYYNDSEQLDIFNALSTYCFINAKKPNALPALLELNKFAAEQYILLEDGYISSGTFRNVTTVAIWNKAFKWGAHFIETYKKYLNEEFKEDVILLYEMKFAIAQKQYEKALDKIILVQKFPSHFDNMEVRCNQLKCYYELTGYRDALKSGIAAFNSYLRRNKEDAAMIKRGMQNFIHFLGKIIKYKEGKKVNLEQVQIAFTAAENIAERDWLIEKITELE